jgi:hypothetical protein
MKRDGHKYLGRDVEDAPLLYHEPPQGLGQNLHTSVLETMDRLAQ